MDIIITRAIELVNKKLLSSSRDRSVDFILVNIRNGLNKLLKENSLKTNWIRLFCRQMNRLMDYNKLISDELWMEWHDDILCILLNGRNGQQLSNDSWERFLYKMEFENKLEEYDLEFQRIFGKRKTLNELICKHNDFFQKYLKKCLSFHLKIQVQGLVGNINDFLNQITDIFLNSERQKYLQEKLKSIEIDLDCSNTLLESYPVDDLLKTNNSIGFLPSVKQTERNIHGKLKKIQDVLETNRWIVILGDPGSSKTTLLRWITHIFAEKILHNNEEFIRIPILIRIGEFAEWIINHQEKTLRDYIGEHTWFSQHYCNVEDGIVLKELIDYGYALILLDGLDEISNIGQRENIVKLVREFIKEYVRASDFVTAFDKKMVRKHMYLHYPDTIETSLPSKSSGNQMIITSRFIGYEFYPIIGPFIEHYSLASMNYRKAKKFVKNFIKLIEENVIDILVNENIKLNEEKRNSLSEKRYICMESIFETKSKFLISNISLLSLISTLIFQSPDDLNLKSPIEVYSDIVKSSLSLWKLNIPESLLIDVFINLATYLHLNSQSGLIDKFDLERLCSLTLKQSRLIKNRTELSQYVNELISFMEKNIAFVVERGLQVFSFQHLLFQEYFVGQALIKSSSIEHIAKRILSFTVDFRFHESILFSVISISYNRSSNVYEEFCQYLVTSTENSSIPFGTILFFDTFDHMKIKPSNSIIFKGLNNLFNHSSILIGATYLLWNLSKLSDDIILEWMKLYINNEESISKFCQCLFRKYSKKSERNQYIQKLPSIVYQQLWSYHNRCPSIEFDIDQVLRIAVVRDNINNEIFNKNLSSYFLLHNISLSTIHPLLLSIIIAVSGGIYYQINDNILQISFSTKQMHRESLIFTPILEYFNNKNESDSEKIGKLKEYYENFLENSLSSDTSSIIVDTFIALICLQGLSQTSIYEKYKIYQAFPLALDRFKWNWFHFMISGLSIDLGTGYIAKISNIKSELKTILDIFSSKSNQFDEQEKHLFFLACANALMKLQRFNMSDLLNFVDSYDNGIIHNIRLYEKSFILLNYLPQSLRKLCSCIINSSTNEKDSLPLIIFLFECMRQLENVRGDDPIFYHGLSILKSLLIEYSFENYGLAIFRGRYSDISRFVTNSQLCDQFFIQPSFNWKMLIDIECERIYQNLNTIENQEKDLQLFAASISLAQIYQSKKTKEEYILSDIENQPIYIAIMNILNPILRIIVLNIILDMNDPFIFHEEQRDELRDEMIGLLYSFILDLSLLPSTYLFIQCYEFQIFFPKLFQEMSIIIGEKFNKTSKNEQEAAFIALRELYNFKLADYLKEFAKQTNNLSDILEFNSTIFHKYFHDKTSFESCNTSLLSIMYLVELTFDVQILKIYIKDNEKKYDLFPELIHRVWNESGRFQKLMTFKLAKLITNNLEYLNKKGISFIKKCISECVSIENSAVSLIEKWLRYKTDKNLKFLAEYAALELLINGSNNSDLNDIVDEMFRTKNYSRIIFVSKRLFASSYINLTIILQILRSLQENIRYASKVSLWINRKDIFELILNLEFNQFISNNNQQNEISIRPFILMINGCSKDVQFYLLEYLHKFINEQLQIENSLNEKYISIIIKWIIERIIEDEKEQILLTNLYEYIFTLLHDQRFPIIQNSISNAIVAVFQNVTQFKTNIFMQDHIMKNLEEVIYYWSRYPIDVLSICLLSYGNCLLRLQILEANSNVSNEIKQTLKNICDVFYPETISIRAGFCLVYSENWNTSYSFVSNIFLDKQNLTSEITFKILLEQTLYRTRNPYYALEDILQNLIIHPESMNIFVIDLYNYLCNKNLNKYMNDRLPNYIQIEKFIQKKHSKIFVDAIKNSSFGENEFKTKLYIYSKNNPIDLEESIDIYCRFGILTVELLDMLESFNGIISNSIWKSSSLNYLKQVSDRDVVEKLFYLLNQNRYNSSFENFLFILQLLIKVNAISLIEVHERLLFIKNISYESSFEWRRKEERIFDFLLENSCFKNERATLHFQTIFTTKNIIDTEFNDQINRSNTTLNINCGGESSVGFVFPKPMIIKYAD